MSAMERARLLFFRTDSQRPEAAAVDDTGEGATGDGATNDGATDDGSWNGAATGCDALAGAELPKLIHSAAFARRFVQMHKHAARQCLHAARLAGRNGKRELQARLLGEARDEHEQARACMRYARECEAQADAMAVAAGVRPEAGRGEPASASAACIQVAAASS